MSPATSSTVQMVSASFPRIFKPSFTTTCTAGTCFVFLLPKRVGADFSSAVRLERAGFSTNPSCSGARNAAKHSHSLSSPVKLVVKKLAAPEGPKLACAERIASMARAECRHPHAVAAGIEPPGRALEKTAS